MRTILFLVMAVGCGTTSDIHDTATCDGWTYAGGGSAWSPKGGCERACATEPANWNSTAGPICGVGSDAPDSTTCSYFTFEGVKGCCQYNGSTADVSMRFYECVAQ